MICRELVAVQDFRPWVAIASHDWSTAVPNSFTEAAAGVDEPSERNGTVLSLELFPASTSEGLTVPEQAQTTSLLKLTAVCCTLE